jgi:hypothetical protein
MNSIPPKTLCELANAVAFELGLPWRVEDLRMKALEVYRTVERRAANSGLSREQASKRVRELIFEQVLKAGKEMDPLPPDQQQPKPEQIETALKAFTVEQWTALIDGFDESAMRAMLSHMRRRADYLKGELDARKVERIESRAIMRDTDLWLRDNRSTLVPISDPYWANVLPELAREANRRGKGHPVRGRSVAEELGSNRGIARRLSKRDHKTDREMKVDDREVKRWRERMAKLPFEQYAAEVGADDEVMSGATFIDYYTMIRRKHQRKH